MNIYNLPYKPSLINEYILHFASQAISTGCFSYFKQQPKLYSFCNPTYWQNAHSHSLNIA